MKKIKEIENNVTNQGDSNPDPKEDPPDNKKPKGRKINKSKEKEKEKSSNNNSTPPPPKDPQHNNNSKKEEDKKTSDNNNNNKDKGKDNKEDDTGSLLPNIDPKISWYLLAALVCGVIAYDSAGKSNSREISYREFIDNYVSSNDVKEIIIQDGKIVYVISKTAGSIYINFYFIYFFSFLHFIF